MATFECDLDLSGVNELSKRLTKVKNSHLEYGWTERKLHKVKGTNKKVPTAQIAFWNEFGTRNIPSRPYLSITSLVLQQSAIPYIQSYFTENILNTVYSESGLDRLSTHVTQEFKNVKGSGKPLAKSTVDKKGHSTHWVETGELMDEWKVDKKKTALRDF